MSMHFNIQYMSVWMWVCEHWMLYWMSFLCKLCMCRALIVLMKCLNGFKKSTSFSSPHSEGAGTPLRQGQDIPLTNAQTGRRWGGGGGRGLETASSNTYNTTQGGRHRAATSLSWFSFYFLVSSPGSLWRGTTQRERKTKGAKPSAWKPVCNMLCHARVTSAASTTGIGHCQEEGMFPAQMLLWTGSSCGFGTVISKPSPEESHGKKSSGQTVHLVLSGCCMCASTAETLSLENCVNSKLKSVSSSHFTVNIFFFFFVF